MSTTGKRPAGRKYFLDMEFNAMPKGRYELISIGIVDETGREFYAESNEFNETLLNPWVLEHVVPLLGSKENRRSLADIRKGVEAFILAESDMAVFWAKNGSQDWFLFMNHVFDGFATLPAHVQTWYHELYQLASEKGKCIKGECKPYLPQQGEGAHNALDDARFDKLLWDYLDPLPSVK